MQSKKDTLFSIKNEELRKRKYSLLAMRLTFIMAFFNIIPFVYDMFHKEYLEQMVIYFFFIVLLCFLLLAMNYLYFLSFLITAVLMMCLEGYAVTTPGVRLSMTEGQLWIWSMLSVIPAWRVRSFLKEQAKEASTQKNDVVI